MLDFVLQISMIVIYLSHAMDMENVQMLLLNTRVTVTKVIQAIPVILVSVCISLQINMNM